MYPSRAKKGDLFRCCCALDKILLPAVHLTGPHEWNPYVLDYSFPSGDGEPTWSTDPTERFAFDPNFDEFGYYTHRAIHTPNILDDSPQHMTPFPTIRAHTHVLRTNYHVSPKQLLIMNTSGLILVRSMLILFRKP